MSAWCPRCDAVRPDGAACPVCGTPLATLARPAPTSGPRPDLPPPAQAPAPPPGRARLRVALAAATLVVAGLAFVAGRSAAGPAAPTATTAAPATSTTAPEPDADARQLGWTATKGRVTVTAVRAGRFATDERETVAWVTLRIRGLPDGQQVLGLRGLQLLDSAGGAFSTVDQQQFGSERGVPVAQDEQDPSSYTLQTGPAPRLSALAQIRLAGLLVIQPSQDALTLDTAGPWPARPPLRAVDPGPDDTFRVDLGFQVIQGTELELQVISAFVGGGRAIVVVDAAPPTFRGVPGEFLPVSAELRAGGRVLCGRTTVLGREPNPEVALGIVLDCPTQPVPQLSVGLGLGVVAVPFDAALRP